MLLVWCVVLVVGLAAAAATDPDSCDLVPEGLHADKSPGDHYYRLMVNGDVELYQPGQRYIVTLVGPRTHQHVQQFTKFKLQTSPLDPASPRSPVKQGQFQLFADTLSKFDEQCTNTVIEADDLPKTEVAVMWKAPPMGSGCVILRAMVFEDEEKWFAEDGELSRRICEDMTYSKPDCCACDDAKYKMVFQGLWSPETHPKDFPKQALWLTHFSDVIGATHPTNFSFWEEGMIATDGFRSLAEWGSVGPVEAELRQQGGLLRSIIKAQGLWHPRVNSNTTAVFTVDRKRHLVSLASMFGPSPDWIVGVSALELCKKDCTWEESKVIDLLPYDAGTDSGLSYMSANAETVPRERMYRITTMYPEDPRGPFYNPEKKEIPPMARLYITKEKVIRRSCDEEILQSMVAEEQENTQSINRPECAVTEYGPWSECSVTCGKGLRSRSRQYHAPQEAQRAACDRQLISKEMCVAAVPECEGDNQSKETSEPALEDRSGVCKTTEWGPWSECSVTCGIGMNTRRRTFINHMGHKKCPLVQIEENRKCMEPECTEKEPEISDPTCPTTEWAGWSPCSASCGRGVRLRTRLLLVPPERQQPCGARVELLQQRTCSDRDDCTIDMLTAKKICMEAPDQGPCRGVYQRWSFMPSKGMCVPFQYGGCRGNSNNFISREDCFNTCRIVLAGDAPAAPLSPASAPSPGVSANSILPQSPSVVSEASDGDGDGKAADCEVGPWSEWSKCSVSCGSGYQERTRSILSPPGPGGAPCPPRLTRRRRCARKC